jgi:hypothetical protein
MPKLSDCIINSVSMFLLNSSLRRCDRVVGWIVPDVSKDCSAGLIMKMKALRSFKMRGTAHSRTWHYILENLNLQQHCCENLIYCSTEKWLGPHLASITLNVLIVFPVVQQPLVGQGLLIIEAAQSHSDTPHSPWLLWTGDQPDTETSTWQVTTLARDRHPCPQRDLNPQSQWANGCRPTP